MRFLTALRFLTIIRTPRWGEIAVEEIGRSTGYFTLVGIIIGFILAGLYWLFHVILPPSVVSGLLIVFAILLSGGLHLDGFIDTFDGLGGHKTPEARWQVMHDSRAGAFGIVGVVSLLLVKYVSLNSLPDSVMIATLVLMPTLGRWAMVYAIFAYPYARGAGLGKIVKQETSWRSLIMATLVALAIAIPWFRLAGLVIVLSAWVVVVSMSTYLKSKFDGLTGDNYGAINEVVEVSVLIMVLLLSYNNWLGLP